MEVSQILSEFCTFGKLLACPTTGHASVTVYPAFPKIWDRPSTDILHWSHLERRVQVVTTRENYVFDIFQANRHNWLLTNLFYGVYKPCILA